MTRKISFYGLLATAIAIGVLFYRVVEPFIFALLFALVLTVLFRPAHIRITHWLKGRRRLAAWLLTLGVLGTVLVPIGALLVMAGVEIQRLSRDVAKLVQEAPVATEDVEETRDAPDEDRLESEAVETIEETLSDADEDEQRSAIAQWIVENYKSLPEEQREQLVESASRAIVGFVEQLYENTMGFLGTVIGFLIGFVVVAMALYYLLADGETILADAKTLLPFEEHEVNELADQFGKVCRGIVLGTVVAALVQATLALFGYVVAGVPNLLLLFVMTIIFAFIPMVGAGTAVTLVSLYLAVDGRYLAAGLLLAYGLGVVATCDNLIRAYIIGNEVKMNPLLVLITVIGAIQLIGLWGIFVGPMVAAFFYAIMKILRERLDREGDSPFIDPRAAEVESPYVAQRQPPQISDS